MAGYQRLRVVIRSSGITRSIPVSQNAVTDCDRWKVLVDRPNGSGAVTTSAARAPTPPYFSAGPLFCASFAVRTRGRAAGRHDADSLPLPRLWWPRPRCPVSGGPDTHEPATPPRGRAHCRRIGAGEPCARRDEEAIMTGIGIAFGLLLGRRA